MVGLAHKKSLKSEGSGKVSGFHFRLFNWIHSPLPFLRFTPPLSPFSLPIMQTRSLISNSERWLYLRTTQRQTIRDLVDLREIWMRIEKDGGGGWRGGWGVGAYSNWKKLVSSWRRERKECSIHLAQKTAYFKQEYCIYSVHVSQERCIQIHSDQCWNITLNVNGKSEKILMSVNLYSRENMKI